MFIVALYILAAPPVGTTSFEPHLNRSMKKKGKERAFITLDFVYSRACGSRVTRAAWCPTLDLRRGKRPVPLPPLQASGKKARPPLSSPSLQLCMFFFALFWVNIRLHFSLLLDPPSPGHPTRFCPEGVAPVSLRRDTRNPGSNLSTCPAGLFPGRFGLFFFFIYTSTYSGWPPERWRGPRTVWVVLQCVGEFDLCGGMCI